MAWTTDDLISEVRRRLRLPTGADSGGVLDSDIVASANRAYLTQTLPFLRSVMEGYGQIEEDVTVVADQADYAVPSRLLGGTFDDLLLVDSSGNERSLEHIPATLAHVYRVSGEWAYSMVGGKVRLSPTPTTAIGTLRFKGVERVTLVRNSAGAQVTTVVDSSQLSVPGASFSNPDTVDIRDQGSPFSARLLGQSVAYVDPDMTAAVGTFSDVAVGDWVTEATESVVIPIPDVLHYALASFVTHATADELGQVEAAGAALQAFGQEMSAARSALSPRARGDHRPVVNRHSASRSRRRWRR